MFERSNGHNSSLEESIPLKSSEGQKELRKKQEELKKKAETLKRVIIVASFISVVLNTIMAIAAFIIAAMRDSAATYAFGADCFLDLTSSAILLWRFFGKDDFQAVQRERKACILLGLLFVVSAIAVICKASVDIAQGDEPLTFRALYILSVFGTIICLSMAAAKGFLARKVQSDSLMLDALNSVISGMLAFVIIASDLIYNFDSRVWYIEPLMSIVLSVFLICYGLKVINDHRKSPQMPPEMLP